MRKILTFKLRTKNPFPIIINIFKNIKIMDNKIIIKGLSLLKVLRVPDYELNKLSVIINDNKYPISFKFKKGLPFIKKYRFNIYRIEVDINEIVTMDIQNKITLDYDGLYYGRIIYNIFDLYKGKNRNSNIVKYMDYSIYLRQTVKNTMYLTIRETNYYDSFEGRKKLFIGYCLSKLYPRNNYALLYEKECSRYEESASVLYEKLIDKGYKNVYYIINKDNPKIDNIDEKYKRNFIYKNSLKHIIYFFNCRKFLGTESLAHSIQLRIANKKAIKKINDNRIKYVFLQHGVMYMISLNSELRTGFRKSTYSFQKTVVSSKEEAKHFIELGGFKRRDLYICGLPKFDKSTRNEDADKIVIMPTWRRWEVNQAAIDYKETNYFKMIERIVESIPESLLSKIVILPHPLMINAIKNNDDYRSYLPDGDFVYDDILKQCSLLITDYSSIAYDAFYRGSNIIFYWEEKKDCLKKYGNSTKLMLNKRNVFGDICMNKEELKLKINDNYLVEQQQKYINRYRKIVQFYDNKNTDRLIKMLKKDGILDEKI